MITDSQPTLAAGSCHLLGCRDLAGFRVHQVDRDVDLSLGPAASKADAFEAEPALSSAGFLHVGDGAAHQELSGGHATHLGRLLAARSPATGSEILLGHGRIAHLGIAQDNELARFVENIGHNCCESVAEIPASPPSGFVLELVHGDRVAQVAGFISGPGR